MIPIRCVIILLTVLTLASSALAQRRGRVFTNEDIPAAAPAPAAAPVPPPPTTETAAGVGSTPNADAPRPPSGLKERFQQLSSAQTALLYLRDEFAQKEMDAPNETLKTRWRSINTAILSVIQGNQEILTEVQGQLKQQESAPPAP